MILNDFTRFEVYHNTEKNHNKVWGHFHHGGTVWTFWGGVGKAWSFKYHGLVEHGPLHNYTGIQAHISQLALTKRDKGYVLIDQPQLDVIDATWRDRFNERFVWFLLQTTTD